MKHKLLKVYFKQWFNSNNEVTKRNLFELIKMNLQEVVKLIEIEVLYIDEQIEKGSTVVTYVIKGDPNRKIRCMEITHEDFLNQNNKTRWYYEFIENKLNGGM